SRRLRTEELRDPRVSGEIAVTMSRFHGMVMPFNKEPKWLFGTMEGYLKQISELTFTEPAQLQQLEQLRGYNLEQEMRSLRDLLESTPSPVVFCHNDVQEGEGFDLGNHFCEWVYSYSHEPWPCFQAHPEHYPSRQQQLHFIRHYLSERAGGPGHAPPQEQARIEEEMLREIDRYGL
ncbi:CHKB kinase, partial [Leptocoma aspasia]|nr:CHKB kinase [Leptocoma aspasia]